MIELAVAGAWRGIPVEAGAWAFSLRRGEELLALGSGLGRPPELSSRLSAQAAALARGLEQARSETGGEDVLVRTLSPGLRGLLARLPAELPRDLAAWVSRAREAAERCSTVRLEIASGGEAERQEGLARELLRGLGARPGSLPLFTGRRPGGNPP